MQIADENRDATTGRISAEIELALDEERRHIAGEIHDTVNAAVLVIRMHAEGIVRQAAADGNAGIEKQTRLILAAADQAYASMRRLSHRLRPEVLDALGLGGAIEAIVRDFDAAHSTCRFEFERVTPDPTHPNCTDRPRAARF